MPTIYVLELLLLFKFLSSQNADALSISIFPSYLIAIVVAWARVELGAHTKAKVAAGAIPRIFLTAMQFKTINKIAGLYIG